MSIERRRFAPAIPVRCTLDDPYLDAGVRGWIHNTAHKNYRRIAGFDKEDLIQEGYLCFYKCKESMYPWLRKRFPSHEDRRTFMGYFQRTFSNRIFDLAKRQSPFTERLALDMVKEVPDREGLTIWDDIIPFHQDEEQTAATMLATASREIKQLLALLVDDAMRFSQYRRYGNHKRARRETNNRYFCRLLGLPPDRDIVGEVKAHFGVE